MNCPKCQAPVDPATQVCPTCGPVPSAAVAEAEGNPGLAFAGGMAGAILGAAVWWFTTTVLNIKLGLVAWGIGIAAGMGVVILGKGRGPTFQMIGALTAVLGLIVGEFMIYRSVAGMDLEEIKKEIASEMQGASPEEIDEAARTVHQTLQQTGFVDYLKEDFSPIDILFIVLAIITGWRIPGAGGQEAEKAT
jgi:hypothetical protein